MTPRFPKEMIKWIRDVEQRLLQFDVDIKRLWKRTPQGWRGTDGETLPAQFPIQEPPPPSISGSSHTVGSGQGFTGTDNTAGTLPSAGCGPCGVAAWVWTGGNSTWNLFTSSCGAGCNPVQPSTPGAYSGEVRYTCCEESLSGTPLSGSTTGCDCGTVTWQWAGRWILVANNCNSPCTNPGPPASQGTDGEQRVVCCTQTTGTPDTGSSVSGTPLSGSPLSGTGTPFTSISGSGTPASGTQGSIYSCSGTSFGSLIVRDFFVDTDGTEIENHTPDLDNGDDTWEVTAGHEADWTIQSNALSTAHNGGESFCLIDAGFSHLSVSGATFGGGDGLGSTEQFGMVFRYSDANNYWLCINNIADNEVQVIKVQAGVRTTMGSSAGTSANLSVSFCGAKIESGSITVNDAFNSDATIVGYYSNRVGVTAAFTSTTFEVMK